MAESHQKYCQGVNKNGTPCRRLSIKGEQYCYAHIIKRKAWFIAKLSGIWQFIFNSCRKNKYIVAGVPFVVAAIGFLGSITDINTYLKSYLEKSRRPLIFIPIDEGVKFGSIIWVEMKKFENDPGHPELVMERLKECLDWVTQNNAYMEEYPVEVAILYQTYSCAYITQAFSGYDLLTPFNHVKHLLERSIHLLNDNKTNVSYATKSDYQIFFSRIDQFGVCFQHLDKNIELFQKTRGLQQLEIIIHNLLYLSMPTSSETEIYQKADFFYKVIANAVKESSVDFHYLENSYNGEFNLAIGRIETILKARNDTYVGGIPYFTKRSNDNSFVWYEFYDNGDTLKFEWEVNKKREIILPKSDLAARLTDLLVGGSVNILSLEKILTKN